MVNMWNKHGECSSKQIFRSEIKAVLGLAWPISVTMLLHVLTAFVSLIFCGHLGKEILDSVSLGSMVINVFGFATTVGLASACDTLFAQSYGSSNKENVGIVFQRGVIILLLTCLPSTAVFLNAEHLLVLLGQSPAISSGAGRYTKVFIAGLPAMALSQVLRRFVYVQGLIAPQIIVFLLANVVNLVSHFIFIVGLNMNIEGAAIAFSITNWSIVVFFALYIVIWKAYKGLWNGFTWMCLEDWGEFFGLAVPGMLMLLMEWASAEVITFMSGLLGETQLAVYTITYGVVMLISMHNNYISLLLSVRHNAIKYTFPIGISFGVTIRLGIHLGGNEPACAKLTSRVAILCASFMGVILALLILAFRGLIPRIVSSDSDVVEGAKELFLVAAVYLLFSGAEQILDGVIRGSGNQMYGSIINITAYLVVCLPIAIPLMLKTQLETVGGYVGLACGALFQTIFFLVGIMRMNWDKEADMAQQRSRVAKEEQSSEMDEVNSYTDLHDKLSVNSTIQEYGIHETSPKLRNTNNSLAEYNTMEEANEKARILQEAPNSHQITKQLILKRALLVILFVAILILAILLDIYLSHRNNYYGETLNKTDPFNYTANRST